MQDNTQIIGRAIAQQRAQDIKNESRKQILVDAKTRVQHVITLIKKFEKVEGRTKKSRKAIKIMEDFLKCNITSPAIYTKYQDVVLLLERYANIARQDQENDNI